MIHVTKQLDFTEGPLCINLVVKCIRNLLDGNVLIRLRVQNRAVHTHNNKKQTQKFSIFHSKKKRKKNTFFSLKFPKKKKHTTKSKKKKKSELGVGFDSKSGKGKKGKRVPNDAVCAFSDGHDGWLVFGGDFEYVAEYVVLDEPATVAQRRRNILDPHRHRRLLRRWRRVGHHGVGRRSSSSSFHCSVVLFFLSFVCLKLKERERRENDS